MNFYEGLEDHTPALAIVDNDGSQYTYGQLARAADTFASNLDNNRKNLVFILCANNYESLVGYLGTLRSGHTAALIAVNTPSDMLSNLLDLYRPDYIWRPDADTHGAGFSYMNYCLDKGDGGREGEIHPDLALLLSTSGSTGSPKMVRLSKRNLNSNAASISEYLRLNASERPITSLPMHYSYGLSVINSHLAAG
ncbi:MAG: AMP-binding protein, partial [Candidatus Zixiibacteriota bacterium]